MITGWIKLHRRFIEWEWYDNANVMRVFLHCLLLANHKDKKWHGKMIKRGTFITSYGKLSSALKLSVQQIRTALDKLSNTDEISIETTNKYTIVTVCNYNTYQERDSESNNQITGKQQSNNNQITTTKNEKKVKNEKNYSDLISDFDRIKKMDKPLTEDQAKKLIDEFGEHSVKEILMSMENYKPLLKKNTSAYLTANNWLKRDAKNGQSNHKVIDGGTW